MPIKLFNTLTRQKEVFTPLRKGRVSFYACGPTVYDYAHLGNLRTYIFEDALKRVFLYNGYKVTHAMNITDVGHLTGDGDEGEDKLEVGAKREGKSPLELAKFYTDKFFADTAKLNIIRPDKILPATKAIAEQIKIIKLLEQKDFTYIGQQAVYFDTSKLPDYGQLTGQKLNEKMAGAREEVVADADKKHPADFALWFFLTGRYKNHVLHWPSPWAPPGSQDKVGGFPGWHIECSAISRRLLGQPFDIHCGGVDHIGTHHPNEMAQSEAAFGVPLCHIWLHGEFMLVDGAKMSKSLGNFITLDQIAAKFSPLAFRYLVLTAHYRSQLNLTWESLEAAQNALRNLYQRTREIIENADPFWPLLKFFRGNAALKISRSYAEAFRERINDDLDTPGALALIWQMLADETLPAAAKKALLLKFDAILGLGLDKIKSARVPKEIKKLAQEREQARQNKNWSKADQLREQMAQESWLVEDTPRGPKLIKK